MARPKEFVDPVIVNLRLEKTSRDALRKEATRRGMSLNRYLIRLIDRAIKTPRQSIGKSRPRGERHWL